MQILKPAVLFLWVLVFSSAHRFAGSSEKMKWLTIQEAADSVAKNQRPIFIDLYTDWCGWCKVMDKKTYTDKRVYEYLQQKFFPVKVDAESKHDITWNGKTYTYNSNAKTNNFAIYLTNGQLEYPTTIIIPPGGEPQAIPGYMTPTELELIVKYFGEGHYGKTSFPEFQKSFKSSW